MTRLRLLVVASLLLGCEDILPVETIERCQGDDPPADCSCADEGEIDEPIGRRAAICPECQTIPPHPDCENAGVEAGATAGAGGAGGASGRGVDAGRHGPDAGGSGAAGSVAVDAGPCARCASGTPHCWQGRECVACLEHGDCQAAAEPRCDAETHTCVACLEHEDCSGDEPVCDPEAHECVECLTDAECPDASRPQCTSNHRCGACTSDGACVGRTGAELCELNSASVRQGECVRCLDHADCENPTPQCSVGECVPCTADAACAARTDTEVCNTLASAETHGQCVQCTGDSEAQQCGARACKRTTGTCTSVNRGTLTPCTRCEADSECLTGARCVAHAASQLGTFCFFDRVTYTGCADVVGALRPYSVSMALPSVDGVNATYCLPRTTCQAFQDATMQKVCSDNANCGELNLTDGYCPESGSAMDRCSYICSAHYDCPINGFTQCLGAGFCQPP